jgi:hypothetical protein
LQFQDSDPGIAESCKTETDYHYQADITKKEILLIEEYLKKYPTEIHNILLNK